MIHDTEEGVFNSTQLCSSFEKRSTEVPTRLKGEVASQSLGYGKFQEFTPSLYLLHAHEQMVGQRASMFSILNGRASSIAMLISI